MLKQSFLSHNANDLYFSFSNSKLNLPKKANRLTSCVLNVGIQDIAEVIHNKVLIAAGLSGAIGQISKPFTSVVFYKKDLDFRTAFQAGGFPSTHSSSVVAAATAIAFERGFSDSIFGLTVVYAALFMYDAQDLEGNGIIIYREKFRLACETEVPEHQIMGVRREVGKHAKVLNKLTSNARISDKDMSLVKGNKMVKSSLQSEEISEEEVVTPLKESIGHTEVEVIAGALFGFLVSFGVYSLM